MLISVVMPYSGCSTLGQALQSLQNQTLPADSFELILVGEAEVPLSEHDLRESCPFDVTYLQYKRPKSFRGHSAGRMRNLGVKYARSRIILFIDSDCVVAPSCLQHHYRLHKRYNGSVVCGAVRELPIHEYALVRHSSPLEFHKLLTQSSEDFRHATSTAHSWQNFYSGNASVPKDLFRRVGGFDESGYRCHDMDLGYELYRKGAIFRFAPDCQVIHIEHPRSIRFRLEQAQGWRHLGKKHVEIRPFAEDCVVNLSRAFEHAFTKCEAQFRELTASLPGIHIDGTWIVPPWCDASEVKAVLNRFPYYIVQQKSHHEAFLRLDRNCWDFSILTVDKKVLSRPDISVLLTTFNSQATVGRAIESVFRQTLQSFEIVVIDDGSTDDTEKVVRAFAIDGRVRLCSNHENRGLACSLNRGLELCRSPIVVQLDSDDWFEPHALEYVWGRLNSDARIGAVYARAISHDGLSRVEEKGFQAKTAEEYLEYPYIQAPRAYRTDSLRKLGGWSIQDVFDGRYFEDRLTLARMCRSATVSFIDSALYNVDLSPDSLSHRNSFRSKMAKLLILSAEANANRLSLKVFPGGRILKAKFCSRRKRPPKDAWSVIIPAHERDELLEYSLRSWMESDLNEALSEIIVVDDASGTPLQSIVDSISKRIRYIRLEKRQGPAYARNVGASCAQHKMLFFSDADRIVPPDVLRTHEVHHSRYSDPCLVVGGLFGRKAGTFLRPRSLDNRINRKLLEQLRFDKERFLSFADACLTGRSVRLIPVASPGKLWDAMEKIAFMDSYLSQWATSVLIDGWDAPNNCRFLRVGTGNLSMLASTFSRVGGFDPAMLSMEDWEFGVRALKTGVRIVSAPEAESYHQVHEIDPFIAKLHGLAIRRFRKKHPDICKALFDGSRHNSVPGLEFIRNNGFRGGLGCEIQDKTRSPYCALTFDDGPHRVGTPEILRALQTHRATGTFFVLGALAAQNKSLLRSIVESGSEVGIHGWIHRRVDEQTTREIIDDLSRTIDVIVSAGARRPKFCRPSYGLATPGYFAAAERLGLDVVGWDVSSRDWEDSSTTDLIVNLSLQTIWGKVLLFHDGCGGLDSSAEVLRWLLTNSDANAKFVSISQFARHLSLPKLNCTLSRL
jgi:glycosyltransferase involved in cell wall biosynthesis/peptidoglycan/xylan/chitin deacetylase (PgdA/CDA1 family)